MAKAWLYKEGDGTKCVAFECPGCGCAHGLRIRQEGKRPEGKASWEFNDDLDSPTLSPSVVVGGKRKCHSFVKDGKIQFLNDSFHELSGKTVELPDCER